MKSIFYKIFAFILVITTILIVTASPPDIVITQPSDNNETIIGSFQFIIHITNQAENMSSVEVIVTNTTGVVESNFTNSNQNTSIEDFAYTLNTAELTNGA